MAKNRTIIGIICIALAFVILLVALPIVNTISDKKIAVVRAFNEIAVGHQITPDDLHPNIAADTGADKCNRQKAGQPEE